MTSSKMTLIYYFVPEDNETDSSLNAFAISKPLAQISTHDILAHFPLSGTYRLSFRVKYSRQLIYILPEKGQNEPVPHAEGRIVVKANRVSWQGPKGGKASALGNGHG